MALKISAAKHQKCFFLANETQNPNKLSRARAQYHWLNERAAKQGKNFYNDYCIFGAVKSSRGNKTNTPEWFLDTLRSQHISYNFFIPLEKERELAVKVLNDIFNLNITEIDKIEIEYPPHKHNPLNDRTSFDAFISYFSDDKNGFIGIEVKYTEGGYSPTSKELELINDKDSVYYQKTDSNLYNDVVHLKDNAYRQIWRNHILASAFKKQGNYDQFISVTIYPNGNDHFDKAISKFRKFLTEEGKQTVLGITFESFFTTLLEFAETDKQRDWISYLTTRYLVK